LITYYATKAYRLTGQKRLSDLSTGFLVLSAGMFGRVIGTLYFIQLGEEGYRLILSIVTIAYGASRIMAYILFVISTRPTQFRQAQEQPDEGNGIGLMLLATFLVDPNLEIVAILVLVIVVLQAIVNYMATRSKFARYVLICFFLLLLSHIWMIQVTTAESAGYYLLSQGAQFLGFLSLLVMLIKAGRD
jgi:hypothetical protein